jgi:SAM-dependent methyltransferase
MNSERIEAILAAVQGSDILNIGCVGHYIPYTDEETKRWLHHQLCVRYPRANVVGLDIDQPNLDRMRQMGFKSELGDAHHLKYESCFDTIILGELIEHLQNPGECLVGCRRALKPGGRIIISTPNVFSVMLGLMYLKNFDTAFNPEHVVWFCPQTLRTLIERSGLVVTQLQFVDDLAPDVVRAPLYRAYAYCWTAIRGLLPRKYKNTMVAVCAAIVQESVSPPGIQRPLLAGMSAPSELPG